MDDSVRLATVLKRNLGFAFAVVTMLIWLALAFWRRLTTAANDLFSMVRTISHYLRCSVCRTM